MWKAPYRLRNKSEISQTFNSGIAYIYDVTVNGSVSGLHPEATEQEAAVLRFEERRLGLQRYQTAKQYHDEIERVIRVPRGSCSIHENDVAIIEGIRYRVAMAQTTTDVYPPCIDLTLARDMPSRHTITVYNIREDPLTFARSVYITVLSNVELSGMESVRAAAGRMLPSGSATLRIPLSTMARDGLTGVSRTWIGPKEYTMAADKSGYWTLDVNRDFIVRGEVVVENGDFQTLNAAYDGVYRVTKVELSDAGVPDVWTLEVGGA